MGATRDGNGGGAGRVELAPFPSLGATLII